MNSWKFSAPKMRITYFPMHFPISFRCDKKQRMAAKEKEWEKSQKELDNIKLSLRHVQEYNERSLGFLKPQ